MPRTKPREVAHAKLQYPVEFPRRQVCETKPVNVEQAALDALRDHGFTVAQDGRMLGYKLVGVTLHFEREAEYDAR